jgi:hypothetical protein
MHRSTLTIYEHQIVPLQIVGEIQALFQIFSAKPLNIPHSLLAFLQTIRDVEDANEIRYMKRSDF